MARNVILATFDTRNPAFERGGDATWRLCLPLAAELTLRPPVTLPC
jgi:hypothetical protein